MGFSQRAHIVRNGGLAYEHRVAALHTCVSLYHPIGHRATLSFLAEVAGPYPRHERALLRALEALEVSHAAWRAEVTAYANERARQKQLGRRLPPYSQPPNRMGGHWYAADPDMSRRAALHALKLWNLDHEQASVDHEVRSLVQCCIATRGRLTREQLDAVLGRPRHDETEDVRWPVTLMVSAAVGR